MSAFHIFYWMDGAQTRGQDRTLCGREHVSGVVISRADPIPERATCKRCRAKHTDI